MEKKVLIRLLGIFVAAVVILTAAVMLLGRELTSFDVVIIALVIAIAAIITIRILGIILAAQNFF